MKSVTVTIEQDGSVKIEASGFKGRACEKATEAIEESLGRSGNRMRKPEWYQSDSASNFQTT